jgi:hypothetical protein
MHFYNKLFKYIGFLKSVYLRRIIKASALLKTGFLEEAGRGEWHGTQPGPAMEGGQTGKNFF